MNSDFKFVECIDSQGRVYLLREYAEGGLPLDVIVADVAVPKGESTLFPSGGTVRATKNWRGGPHPNCQFR